MNEINIKSRRSEIAEALGVLSAVSTYGSDAFDGIDVLLEPEDLKAFALWQSFSFKGLEIGNLFLVIDPFCTFDRFIEQIEQLSTVEFQYYLLSENIPREVLESITKESKSIDDYVQQSAYIDNDQLKRIKWIVAETDEVRLNLIKTLKLCHQWLKNNEKKLTPSMDIFLMAVNERLKKIAPLEYAQELMGKKFKRVSDYKEYLFIPTYYSGLNCIRFFDESTLIILDRIGPSWDSVSSETLAKALKVLSDATRIDIIAFIADRPSYGIELAERFGVSRPTISHHLEQMNSIGLVHMERVKNTKYYSLNKRRYKALIEELNDYIFKTS